jgi:hypothetical protein
MKSQSAGKWNLVVLAPRSAKCADQKDRSEAAVETNSRLFFFKCSVSEDLFGASPNPDGTPLPTPGGGKWLPLAALDEKGSEPAGFDASAARAEIEQWGCHWFTTKGPRDIYWGPGGPPKSAAMA